MDHLHEWFHKGQTRRQVLKELGLLAGATFTLGACGPDNALRPSPTPPPPKGGPDAIEHVLVACQENRTFDEYYGHYAKAGTFGIPANYSLPDGKGGTVTPYHFSFPISPGIAHNWSDIHREWNHGAMDGFFTADGHDALGYYDGSDIAYYYALADAFTLCGNYFCSLLGPTLPNRLALFTGTAGGITSGKPQPGSLDWPTIVDLLDAQQITWKCYNLGTGLGSVPEVEFFNILPFFKRWQHDSRLFFKESDYFNDVSAGKLPQVTFLISDALISEHPPIDIHLGQSKMAQVINALIASPLWTRSAMFFTYDEGGGYFDHVAPPKVDAFGFGLRVPTLVVSPWAKRGYVSGQLYEHSSILKFIEKRFGLPTLASVNHQFDRSTPGQNNEAANGKTSGPPAPPHDGLAQIGDFSKAFDFTQDPHYQPKLPSV